MAAVLGANFVGGAKIATATAAVECTATISTVASCIAPNIMAALGMELPYSASEDLIKASWAEKS